MGAMTVESAPANDGDQTYPRGVPMVRDWSALSRSRALAAPPAPHPAPSVPARPAAAGELPPGAARLLKAVRAPWSATATYAKGTPLPAQGRQLGDEVESIAVRLKKPGGRAWAVWTHKPTGWSFTAAQVADEAGWRKLAAADVTKLVKGEL